MEERDLENLFGDARRQATSPPSDLFVRILADAETELQGRKAAARPVAHADATWSAFGWLRSLGGGGAIAGLISAAMAGVWLGIAQPQPVSGVAQSIADALGIDAGTIEVELLPGIDPFTIEG